MNDELLHYLLAQHAPAQPRRSAFRDACAAALSLLSTVVLVALAVCGGYFLLVIYFDTPAAPATSAPARAPTALPLPPPSRPVIAAPQVSLPDCATVADTTTACVRTVDLAPPTATEEPAPIATAEQPAYETACITPPGERPCWLPADQPWQPPADVPATPMVLIDVGWHPPLAVKCADWHPPQALPEGCGE